MTLSALGIFSAAGAGGVQGDYELIETVILTSNQASVTFSNLGNYSSVYKHLQIRSLARNTRAETADGLYINLNASTTGYANHSLVGNGSAVSSSAETSQAQMTLASITSANSAANNFAASVIDLLDAYSTTKNKTLRGFSGLTDRNLVQLNSGLWNNTASVTSIKLQSFAGNLVTGSRFSLYGIRG
jgi:hypothetical protein